MKQIVIKVGEKTDVERAINAELERFEADQLEIHDLKISGSDRRITAMIVYDDGRSHLAARRGQGA